MINIEIKMNPTAKVVGRSLREMSEEIDDLRAPLARMKNPLAASIRKIFATRGQEVGDPWSPIDKEYANRKLIRGLGIAPLVRTGNLSKILKSPRGHIQQRGAKLIFSTGTKAPYAKAVHSKRALVGISRELVKQADIALGKHIDSKIKRTVVDLAKARKGTRNG